MVTVEETYMPLTLFAPHLTDGEFQEFCDRYSDYRLEYTSEGELIIMPPPIRRPAFVTLPSPSD